jgi:PAS domain S-box-containing protein
MSPAAMRLLEVETGRVINANDNFLRLTGYSRKEVIGHSSHELDILREKKEARLERVKILRKTGRLIDLEMKIYTKSGEERICLMSSELLKLGDKEYSLSALKDITERKQAEEALRQSEKKYSTLVEQGSDGIAIIQDGLVAFVNSKIRETYGFTQEELLGKAFLDWVSPEYRGLVSDRYKKRMAGEKTPNNYEIEILAKDGTKRLVEISASQIEYDERPAELVITRDITDRKQAEEEIRRLLDRESQAAREWQETFDAVTDIVTLISPHHELLRVNRAVCVVMGKKPEELIGKKCYEVVHGLSAPIKGCPCVEALKTKKTCTSEIAEQGRYYQLTAYPIFDKGGEIISFAHIVKDITERKRMEEQLMAQDRLASIGQLVSGVAHEINNPLTGVIGFSDMLLKRDLPDDVKEDLKVINDEAMRTARIVKNLLTFARKQPEGKAPVDINEQIERVIKLRDHEQKVNNIRVITHFASDLPQVTGNSSQLQQVFFNIVINAEFFMLEAHQKGDLTITTERIGDFVRASFADDGPGISNENMKHLFIPFFTTKEVGKGTGLGLSICHGIITEHGGRIYAESKLGKGATFVVELPVSKQ